MFVAIQMIGRYVQDQRNFRTEMDNALQLKTAQLQNEIFWGWAERSASMIKWLKAVRCCRHNTVRIEYL
jgi:hypothetical protein